MQKYFYRSGIFVFTCICLFNTPSWAEKLTIISKNPESSIFVNDNLIGKFKVNDFEVVPGSYIVKVTNELGEVVYENTVRVPAGESVSLLAANSGVQAKSPVPDIGSKKEEALRARQSRGNVGFGLNGGIIPGLSLRWFLTQNFGVEANGFFYSDSGSNKNYSSWELRGIYVLSNTLINNFPGNGYCAVSVGKQDNGNQTFELGLGMEVSALTVFQKSNDKSGNPFSSAGDFLLTDTAYLNFEFGYGNYYSPISRYVGITGRIGARYYF